MKKLFKLMMFNAPLRAKQAAPKKQKTRAGGVGGRA